MSFSSEIKQELSWQLPSARHCRLAEISAILSFCSHVEAGTEGTGNVRMHTENLAVARKYFTLLKKTFNINMNVSVRQNRKPHGNRSFEITALTDMTAVRHVLIQNPCCRRAYIRGAFLASGSVSDPEKGYHFEIVCADSARAEQLSAMLESFGIEAKITLRKHSYILYVKEGSQIADILNVMEAHVGLMKFENIRISRDFTNSLTRLNNCDVANEVKSQTAARKQLEDIARIEEMRLHPGEKLQIVMDLRKENPEASLLELCALYEEKTGTAVSKSGMKHRFVRIHELAEKGGKQ